MDLGILEEYDEGQMYRFYVYDFDAEDYVSWFNTFQEAEMFLQYIYKHKANYV